MAHWKNAAVTNVGVEMLNEWMAGRFIKITAAYGGTGTVEPEELVNQTGLVDQRQGLQLLGEENGLEGKTVRVQEERLLFIMQDEQGVTIPSSFDAGFLLELYCMIGITNTGRFEVSMSSAGVVTTAYMREVLEKTMQEHNADEGAHADIREKIENVTTGSANIETAVADVDARLALLELMYRTQVSGNPFTVSFENMSGLLVTGIWNAAQKRVEF